MKHAFRRLVLSSLAAGLLAAPTAHADFGTYTQYACRTPDGAPAPADGFQHVHFGDDPWNTCATGGSMDVVMESHPDDTPYGSVAHWFYNAPDQTSIVGLTMR